jgi:hypothetical protein
VKVNIYRLPDDTIHVSWIGGEDAGVMKLEAVSQTNSKFQLEMPAVLLPEQNN